MLSPSNSSSHAAENIDSNELGNVSVPGCWPPFPGQSGVHSIADDIPGCSLSNHSPAYDPAVNLLRSESTQSSPSSIYDLPYYTPEASSPISLTAVDSFELAPPSPFQFPGDLTGFPNSLQSAEEAENSFNSHVLIPCSPHGNVRLPSGLPLLFQPPAHSTANPLQSDLPDSQAIGLSPKPLFPSQSHLDLPRFYSPTTHGTDGAINDSASAVAHIKALGDDALTAYSSRGLVIYKVESIILNAISTNVIHLQSDSPREFLEASYNVLIDTRNAISMRQSIILADIGQCLQQLVTRLDAYDSGDAARTYVDHEIEFIEEENQKRSLSINFYGLECHRSSCSNYGPSFLQTNRLLYLKLQSILDVSGVFQSAASAFMNDPSLLRERPSRLSHFFTC